MATSSYPQQGLFPGDGPDCGPYTANEWKGQILTRQRAGGMVRTGAASPPGLPATPLYPNVGVYYVCPDRLAVTSPGASQIAIATGAVLCDGVFFYNDTPITPIAITNPGGNPRIDMIVVRQNYFGADYTSVNAPGLVVTDNTADLAIISGAENVTPVPPTPTQDQDRAQYWDIPLFQYQIAVGGAITNLTDLREWVDAETKHLLVPFQSGYDITLFDPLVYEATGAGLDMPQDSDTYLSAFWEYPADYISGLQTTPLIINPGSVGDVRVQNSLAYGACGELAAANIDNTGYVNITVPGVALTNFCLTGITETPTVEPALGDIFRLTLFREGSAGADTAANTLGVGMLVEYFGWGRK